jgi:hypothetical protein
MSQFPIEINDSQGINDAVNYLLSGPAGLGQNFEGFAAYQPAYLRSSFRQPWSVSITTQLNPSIYLALPISNAQPVGGNPSFQVEFTFATPQATAPFEWGDRLQVTGVTDDGSGFAYNDSSYAYIVISSSVTSVIIQYTPDSGNPGSWSIYISGGEIGRDRMNRPLDTDCNARVTVAGPTDQVFVAAQLDLTWEYTCTMADDYDVVVAIYRSQGFPTASTTNNDYLFSNSVLISEKTFARSVTAGTGTQSLEAVFSTVLDGPGLPFGLYWYILSVEFQVPGGAQGSLVSYVLGGTRLPQVTTTYSSLFPVTVTGSGSGLEIDVDLDDLPPDTYNSLGPGAVNSYITTVDTGADYRLDDQLLVAGTDLGGATPANDMTITVSAVVLPSSGTYNIAIGAVTTGLRSLTAQVIKQ